jgi:ABC-type cobalamin transport system ATPase subunit
MTRIIPLDPVPAPQADADIGANRDPLSGEVGAHPIGVGIGAAAAGMAFGAAVGTVTGPIGMAVGALVGAVAGGLAGKGVAEAVDPTSEDAYWRANYASRAYATPRDADDDWGPAYAYGVAHYNRNAASSLEDVEGEMERGWAQARGTSSMEWTRARLAAFDAWQKSREADDRLA